MSAQDELKKYLQPVSKWTEKQIEEVHTYIQDPNISESERHKLLETSLYLHMYYELIKEQFVNENSYHTAR